MTIHHLVHFVAGMQMKGAFTPNSSSHSELVAGCARGPRGGIRYDVCRADNRSWGCVECCPILNCQSRDTDVISLKRRSFQLGRQWHAYVMHVTACRKYAHESSLAFLRSLPTPNRASRISTGNETIDRKGASIC